MSCFLCVVKYFNHEGRVRYSYFYVDAHTPTEAKQEALNELDPGEELITVAKDMESMTGWEQVVHHLEESQIDYD